MKRSISRVTVPLLRTFGVTLIMLGTMVSGATIFADDPGTEPVAPRCRDVAGAGVCTNFGCPPGIPRCDIPPGQFACTCF